MEKTQVSPDNIYCNSYVLQVSTGSSCSTKLTSLSGLSSLERSFQNNKHLEDLAGFAISKARKGPCRRCCPSLWSACSAKDNPLPENPTVCQKMKNLLLCPPHGCIAKALALVLGAALFWGCLWATTGSEALPGGHVFSLFVIFCLGQVIGHLLNIINVHPLVGMLLVACVMANSPIHGIAVDSGLKSSAVLRSVAAALVLLKAGLGFEPALFRRLQPCLLLRLACLPCITEMLVITLTSRMLLQMPWTAATLMGCTIASVSEPLLCPILLTLEEKGFGGREGVTSVLLSAAAIEGSLVILVFSVVVSIELSHGDLAIRILHGPMETGVGLLYGLIMGALLCFIPEAKHRHILIFRTVLLLLTGSMALLGSRFLGIPGGAAIGCFLSALSAGLAWRKQRHKYLIVQLHKILNGLLWVGEPLLYCLLGIELQLKDLNTKSLGLLVAVLAIGVLSRSLATILAVSPSRLTKKERLFMSFAWLPKATYQAVLAVVLMDSSSSNAENSHITTVILGSALSILLTAPSGGALVKLVGPHLLRQHPFVEGSNEYDEDALSADQQDLTWDDHLDFDTELTKTPIDLSKPREVVRERETVT